MTTANTGTGSPSFIKVPLKTNLCPKSIKVIASCHPN